MFPLRFLFIGFMMVAVTARAQNDTALIARGVAFLHTEDFRAQYRAHQDSMLANTPQRPPDKKKRKARKYPSYHQNWRNFWTQSPCFVADSNYYRPDLSTRVDYRSDSLYFRRFDTLAYRKSDIPCPNGHRVSARLLAKGIIEFEHFSGSGGGSFRFGELYRVRFREEGGHFYLLGEYGAILN